MTGVLLADGTMQAAGTVVLAAGPWSLALAAPLPDRDFRLSRFAEDDPLSSPHPCAGAGQLR